MLRRPSILSYDIIYVMSGGKTGSKTLLHSFSKMHPTVRHTHTADPVLMSVRRGMSVLIVNSFRETIGRHISSLFHNLKRDHVRDIDFSLPLAHNYPRVAARMDEYMTTSHFFESYHPLSDFMAFHKKPLTFDREKKWCFHHRVLPNVDLLMLRFDQIASWQDQVRTVFPFFRVVPANLSDRKIYSSLFSHFKTHYPLHPDFKRLFEEERPLLATYMTEDEMNTIYSKYFAAIQ